MMEILHRSVDTENLQDADELILADVGNLDNAVVLALEGNVNLGVEVAGELLAHLLIGSGERFGRGDGLG